MKGCGTETDIFHIIILITFILGFESKHCVQGMFGKLEISHWLKISVSISVQTQIKFFQDKLYPDYGFVSHCSPQTGTLGSHNAH